MAFYIEKIYKRKENHEMKKRIVSLLLALVMAVSLLPVSAFAAEVDVPAAQDVPTVEQQNDENTTPDTPAEKPQ